MLRGNHACPATTLIKITKDTKEKQQKSQEIKEEKGVNREGRPGTSLNTHTIQYDTIFFIVI